VTDTDMVSGMAQFELGQSGNFNSKKLNTVHLKTYLYSVAAIIWDNKSLLKGI